MSAGHSCASAREVHLRPSVCLCHVSVCLTVCVCARARRRRLWFELPVVPALSSRGLNWPCAREDDGRSALRAYGVAPRQRLCLSSRGLNWGIGAGILPLPAIDAGAQPIRRGPYHSSIHPPGFIGGRLGVCRQLAGGLSVWWGGFRDRSASMPPYLPVPRWRDPAPASGAIARSVTTPAGATRFDRRRHRRGRRHGVDSPSLPVGVSVAGGWHAGTALHTPGGDRKTPPPRTSPPLRRPPPRLAAAPRHRLASPCTVLSTASHLFRSEGRSPK